LAPAERVDFGTGRERGLWHRQREGTLAAAERGDFGRENYYLHYLANYDVITKLKTDYFIRRASTVT